MKLPNFCIVHPVITVILNALSVLIGILCFNTLSIREYPTVHIPEVSVRTHYPSASADTVEQTITNPLEDRLAGIEGLDKIESRSLYGSSDITMTFRDGTSINAALLAIREAIGLAELPDGAKPPVIQRTTPESSGLPFITLSIESPSLGFGELTHYAQLNLANAFRSIKGVASAEVWGQPYTCTITLDQKKMYALGINSDDVIKALKNSHQSLPAGKFQNEIPVTINSDLQTVEDFENMWIKDIKRHGEQGKSMSVRLKHISTVKMDVIKDNFRVRINGNPGLVLAINKTPDGNPIEVSRLVHAQLNDLKPSLPPEISISLLSDSAEFVESSIHNVQKSIVEAILCVLAIVFLFLRNLRATLIPIITIPLSLLGSFIFLKVCGCSLNILTLLAMVLSIGLVVDDAIVVLENIQRLIEDGMKPFEAALKGSKEIGFAIVAMTLTLTSVYMPLIFIQGIIGHLFLEFAIALAGSVLISGIIALTLSPLMCAKILSHTNQPLWPQFDREFEKLSTCYKNFLTKLFTWRWQWIAIVIPFLSIFFYLVNTLQNEVAPKEDRGLVGAFIQPIIGKNIDAIDDALQHIEKEIGTIPEARASLAFMGDWGGNMIFPLKSLSDRTSSAKDLVNRIEKKTKNMPSITVIPWSLDTGLPGIESHGGEQELTLVISTTKSYQDLFDISNKAIKNIRNGQFSSIVHNLKMDTPQYHVNLHMNEMEHLQIQPSQIAKTIEIFFSGDKTQIFFKDGIAYPITIKGEKDVFDLNGLYITNPFGKRISIGAIADLVASAGPFQLFHYNQMRSLEFTASLPSHLSMEQGCNQFLSEINDHIPSDFKKTWIGQAKMLGKSKHTLLILLLLAIIFVYAIMAMQFENFIDPLIIILTVPFACIGGLAFTWMVDGSLNIYTQIGLITLIGLITKHGILIVSFTNQQDLKMPLMERIIQAAQLRLRPILMTTGAMILGVLPLLLSHGSGYESRHAIGWVLFGGLITGTMLTLFFLPVICFHIKKYQKSTLMLNT